MAWKSLSNDKVIKTILNDKIILIALKDYKKIITPLFCPICEFPMKTKEDGISYRKLGCCEKCDNIWTNRPGIDWEKNIWPDKSSKDWQDYYNERVILSRPIINIK